MSSEERNYYPALSSQIEITDTKRLVLMGCCLYYSLILPYFSNCAQAYLAQYISIQYKSTSYSTQEDDKNRLQFAIAGTYTNSLFQEFRLLHCEDNVCKFVLSCPRTIL